MSEEEQQTAIKYMKDKNPLCACANCQKPKNRRHTQHYPPEDIEYAYDDNGNQIKDLNKGITAIKYNLLNLPRRISFNGVNKPETEYVYSASGTKLSVMHRSSTEKRTDYVSYVIYENGSLKCIWGDGGYIESGQYHFYLCDHLGDNRVVAKADGSAVQTNHYYPYGMTFAEICKE
ncbi:RHS repeat domain-containing protein [Bacteroides reticulotermitis]|uniref:Cell wall-associated protein n=2 Tax=Bacteroides reticulotermitis TaxID=1133319 RepID=W4UT83_9BACE|nr:hypothetical protein [Bacteroides reticulotermitis]MBB4045363.1 uncharacterized protein RhaS with RHS repeats [Bacteroides reticulotermitis]GAE84156.1 cell wall-associated protein precursor [Bacteroides reticulotermitis JCM 10512]